MKSVIVSLLLFCPLLVFAAEPIVSFQIPQHWRSDTENNFISPTVEPAFVKGTDLILQTHLDALKNAKVPSTNSAWYLHSILFDLGVSTEGKLGTLLLRGNPSVNIYWSKRQKNLNLQESDQEIKAENDLLITNDKVLDKQVQAIVSGIYATGRVRYSPTLVTDIKRTASNFFALMDSMEISQQQRWKLSKIRLDLNVGASGTVSFIQTVGGTVRVRFDWVPTQKPKFHSLSNPQSVVAAGMNNVLGTLVQELDLWSETHEPAHFKLASIRVGLGIGARFTVGLAKSSASALIHAVFVPNESHRLSFRQQVEPSDDGIPFTMVDNQSSWGEALGMSSPNIYAMDLDLDPIIVKRERIQSGLDRAMRIGNFFVDRSSSVLSGSEWYVSRIKTGLDLGVGGTFGLPTILGLVSLETVFDNK